MRKRALAGIFAGLTSFTANSAWAQPTPAKIGWLAKANVATATAAAKKWRSDSQLFQISSFNVQDGVAMWHYDFLSPGVTGKCYRVMLGLKGETAGTEARCENESRLADFTVDSDKAFATARKAGFARQSLHGTLRMLPVRNMGDRPIWLLSEGAKPGDRMIEVDAVTGEIRSQTKIP